jgi:hypothetical protein
MKKVCLWVLFLACFIGNVSLAFAWDGRLKPDEFVLFLPGLAVEQADGSFNVDINGWVFEEESRRLVVSALTSWLKLDFDELSPVQRDLFNERTRYFRTGSERGKRLQLRVAGEVLALPRTDGSGRTRTEVNVRNEEVKWMDTSSGFGLVDWTLEAPEHPLHGQEGHAWVIPAEGVSIVSDIDDTIKISNVQDKKTLMRNTFVEPFQAVPGMAEWYQEMAHNEQWAFFHYLSAAPIQLYPALSEFLKGGETNPFPPGILHLRESTSWRTIYGNQNDTITHKKSVLARLLSVYPQRKFILIGDSGESDPEIYADIARIYPERILAIHIRNVTNEDRTAPRYQQTFAKIDPQIWHIRN